MTLDEFRNLLLTVTPHVYHLEALKAKEDYVVWSEIGESALYADNQRSQVVKIVQVEYWTKLEYPPLIQVLIHTLDSNDSIAISGPIFDYDEKTRMRRYILDCEVL